MISKILIYVENKDYIDDYRKAGITAFLFALKDYSIGYNTYSLEEINKIEVSNKYLLLNRVLDCKDIDNLKLLLPQITNIKGIIYEDIGVYNLIKELNLDIELIHFQNHYGTNIETINSWLNRVDSIFVSNELTKEEIDYIVDNAKKPVCLHLYGYNQVMYSRRLLLTNWSNEFNIDYKNTNKITDKATKVQFNAIESPYGTVMYSGNIYNGKDIYNKNNVLYYYINTMLIPHEQIMNFINNIENNTNDNEDSGFLYKETIYKLKERAK